MKSRLLLLVHTHAHAAALMGCLPFIEAHFHTLWVVYSPAVLADEKTVAAQFDKDISELEAAMDAAYRRRDGAGGDQLKAQYDSKILGKAAHVKEAWKILTPEQQNEAVAKLFVPFHAALQKAGLTAAITQAQDHFETAAHVEFQNSLKAAMKKGFEAGDYMVAWPSALPREAHALHSDSLAPHFEEAAKSLAASIVATRPETLPANAGDTVRRIDKRKKENRDPAPCDPRKRELMSMGLDDLGPIAMSLGVLHSDPIMGKRLALVYRILDLEKAKAAVAA